ncbi:MAG: glycosidase [Limnochordia bacterium]|mgnify:CR=1 FL=1|jgi:predicted GH43/DUF377 family glycosyl hydrolase
MFRLRRLADQPVLAPITANPWERAAVFNCAAVLHEGRVHLIYRAADKDFAVLRCPKPEEALKFTSSFGLAVSDDGIEFTREPQPLFQGEGEQEAWGVEDPRVSKIGDTFYMVYTAFGGRSWEDHRIALASSPDLRTWQRRGVLLDEPNKDGALLEDMYDGRYLLFHRRVPHIWTAVSPDLKNWHDHKILMETIPGWEGLKIGIAGPPVATRQGYLMIYHAVDKKNTYRLGAALLDGEDPTKVVRRLPEPILEPELEWEKVGHVPNVVFSCGQVVKDGFLYVYYGAADQVIGVAGIELDEVVF